MKIIRNRRYEAVWLNRNIYYHVNTINIMSILPKKKPKLSKDEELEETKVKIKDLQMNLKRAIRALLKRAQSLEESRKAAQERNYNDIERGLEKQIEDVRAFTTYFDRTNILLDSISSQLDMYNDAGKAMDLIGKSEVVFQALKITPDQQASYLRSLASIKDIADNNLNSINDQVERINENLGFSENSDSPISEDELLTNFLTKRSAKSNKPAEKDDEIDAELEKRNAEHE
ncbi:hypothetical protein FAD_0484 [Ferroplasma acidiphilum]|jgi:hypothetical protein|uniref:Uncharacterized protein n=3 Tax=Ferroplasma TaxID=74968 RepID=S0ARQ9_FERAC|nr:hypothetical protein FACI_IFERC00001G1502 [Ferroplasma acidarmanus Fer1]ARD84398.1 hypothetical protein FAD_0484 [Ferroplasma acidiphilum]